MENKVRVHCIDIVWDTFDEEAYDYDNPAEMGLPSEETIEVCREDVNNLEEIVYSKLMDKYHYPIDSIGDIIVSNRT